MLSPFVLLILFSLSVDSLLINVKKSCMPSQVAKGPCHTCVCNIEGIFKCQATGCQNQTFAYSGKVNKGECQPMMTYQYEDLYCTCNYEGKWMSYNCRAYFQNITLDDNNIHNKNLRIDFVSDNQFPKGDIEQIKEGDSCVPGKLYKMSCNTCQCAPNNALICTKMLCINSTVHQKIKSVKNKRNKTIGFKRRIVPARESSNKLKRLPNIVPARHCVPGRLYRNGCLKCLCRHNHVYSCTKKCRSSVSNRISDYEISQIETRSISDIPRLPHVGSECEPGYSYAVSCNVCFCSDVCDLVCTMKYCLNISSYAIIQANKLTGTPCTKDYIKQCAKCQCVRGKSVCTGLRKCVTEEDGKQLLSYAGNKVKLSLDATKDRCVPNATYKVHCNDCFCQPDGSLRCTQKTCLTHSQAQELNERQIYLVKYGL